MEYTNIAYVIAAILFILGIKKLSSPKTARKGNAIASVGMLIAIVATLVSNGNMDYQTIAIGMIIGAIIGAFFAIKVEMTQMPQMVAIFNGFGGGASALVAAAEYFNPANPSTFNTATIAISVFVGTLTFTGSFIAFGKLQGFISGKPIVFPGQKIINALMALAIILLGVYTVVGGDTESYFYGLIILDTFSDLSALSALSDRSALAYLKLF